MEQALRKIIELDEMTEEYRKQSDKIIENVKLESNEKLKHMNSELQDKIAAYNQKITSEKIQEAKRLSKDICKSRDETVKAIKENYKNKKEELVKEIFNLIIKDSG